MVVIITFETAELFASKNRDITHIVFDKVIEQKETYFKLTDEPKE